MCVSSTVAVVDIVVIPTSSYPLQGPDAIRNRPGCCQHAIKAATLVATYLVLYVQVITRLIGMRAGDSHRHRN